MDNKSITQAPAKPDSTLVSQGVQCEFKLPPDKQTVECLSDEEVEASCRRIMEKYAPALRELAK